MKRPRWAAHVGDFRYQHQARIHTHPARAQATVPTWWPWWPAGTYHSHQQLVEPLQLKFRLGPHVWAQGGLEEIDASARQHLPRGPSRVGVVIDLQMRSPSLSTSLAKNAVSWPGPGPCLSPTGLSLSLCAHGMHLDVRPFSPAGPGADAQPSTASPRQQGTLFYPALISHPSKRLGKFH